MFAKHEQRSTPSQKQSLVIATSPPAVTSTPSRKGLREECERAPTQRRAPVQRTAPFLGCSGIPTWRLITLLGIRYCQHFCHYQGAPGEVWPPGKELNDVSSTSVLQTLLASHCLFICFSINISTFYHMM